MKFASDILSTLSRYETILANPMGVAVLDIWREQEAHLPLYKSTKEHAAIAGYIYFLSEHSRYLARLLELHPDSFLQFLQGNDTAYCQQIILQLNQQQTQDMNAVQARKSIRQAKQKISLMIALNDIAGRWSLETVTGWLSDFADASVQFALEQVYRASIPKQLLLPDTIHSQTSGISILGMGKLGGRELNYSSDIDLIAIFDPERLEFLAPPARSRFAVRIIQQLASFLQDRDEEGYVFRVDLRLRPDPASTGLAVAYDTAVRYYEQVGQNWERAAMIKARPIAGDMKLARNFLSMLQSFIWRSHLDFAAIEDILSIKRQMQATEEPEITLSGHHLKTGYGGIREIEFLAQIHQLIWGGRLPELRIRPTCEVLNRLVALDLITAEQNQLLQESYRLYRTIEHRLQMRLDQQTHKMPDKPEEIAKLADFLGYEDTEAFESLLLSTLNQVHGLFVQAFPESPPLGHEGKLVFTGVEHDPETLATLSHMGYKDTESVSFAIQQWHKGTKRCTRTKRAREILTELVPLILTELAHTADPDQAFKRFDAFLDALPVGVQPFSLFNSNHQLLTVIADITGNTPILAKMLSHYPELLDLLVASQTVDLPFRYAHLAEDLQMWLKLARDEEEMIHNFCMFKIEQEFLVGVQLLQRRISAHAASKYLTQLADMMIHQGMEMVVSQLNQKYHMKPELHVAVIALGKLGTSELMMGSDLDIMCIYDIPDDGSLTSDEMIALTQYYNRLTTRFINLLSQPVKNGTLYEMDTKLRPYGSQGAVAVKLDTFSEYYATSAWIVENLALLQARIVYASDAIAEPLSQALKKAQRIPDPPSEISDAIHETRKKISEQHYSSNPWDIKYVWGGLMDMQWILKGLMAKYSQTHELPSQGMATPEHINWLYTIHAIDANQQQLLLEGHGLFHIVLSYLRLCHGDTLHEESVTDGLKQVLAEITGAPGFSHLQKQLLRLEAQIYHMYQNLTYM